VPAVLIGMAWEIPRPHFISRKSSDKNCRAGIVH